MPKTQTVTGKLFEAPLKVGGRNGNYIAGTPGDIVKIELPKGTIIITATDYNKMKKRIKALENIISVSAPLCWVNKADEVGAYEWEKRALKLLQEGK